ncbi:MAG: hypothetical protein ABI675_00665 [Chitinophagaceae bacterium]
MKQVKIWEILVLSLINFSVVMAQSAKKTTTDEKISAQFNKTLSKLGKTDISQSKQVQKNAAIELTDDELVPLFLPTIIAAQEKSKKEMEEKRKEYIPASSNKSQQIDKDLLALLAGMPEPITNLPAAKKEMRLKYDENIYSGYIKMLESRQAQMEESARQSIPDDMKNPELVKKEAYKNAAKAQQDLNNNPVIRKMGGLENLKNMTHAQREALAKQMTAKIKQDPMAYTGSDADPRKAFAGKMMTDPGYAARYNHMNNQQKKEEYDLFLSENGFVGNSSQADRDKSLDDRNKALTAIAIDKRLATIRVHMGELAAIAGLLQTRTDEAFNELNNKISKEYGQRIAALPEVEHGEAGRGKDTYPVDLAYNIIVYPVNTQNAASTKEVWKRYADVLKITIAEYNELLSDFWGKDNTTNRLMAERNLVPAGISAGICEELIRLTKMAASQTNQNASWQRIYDEKVLSIYE